MIHTTSNKRKSWYKRRIEGFSVGPALKRYRYIQAVYSKTKALIIINTAEYLHEYLTQPHITAEYRMTHAIQFLTAALKDVPASICDSQLAAIEAVREIFTNGRTLESSPHKKPISPLIPRQEALARYPTPTSKGGQENHTDITSKGAVQQKVITIPKKAQVKINSADDQEPIARRTRSSIDTSNLRPTGPALKHYHCIQAIDRKTRH